MELELKAGWAFTRVGVVMDTDDSVPAGTDESFLGIPVAEGGGISCMSGEFLHFDSIFDIDGDDLALGIAEEEFPFS